MSFRISSIHIECDGDGCEASTISSTLSRFDLNAHFEGCGWVVQRDVTPHRHHCPACVEAGRHEQAATAADAGGQQ